MPTATPTEEPTAEPTSEPTVEPTKPTAEPTVVLTTEPSVEVTAEPTAEITGTPTNEPTAEPTGTPTEPPTAEPTDTPTALPTIQLTGRPTAAPSTGVPVSLVGGDCAPSDVMLVLDSSESVHEDDWQRFKKFTHEVVNALPISKDEMHVGIVEFATDVKTVITVTQDKDELNKALTENLSKQTTGQTNTHKAIREAVKDLKQNGQAGKPKLIFLLTDGLPTDRDAAGAAFAEAKAAGVRVQIVTIGMIVSYVPTPVEWYTAGFPPIKFTMGYSELVSHLQTVTKAICKLSSGGSTPAPSAKFTFPPIPASPTASPTLAC